MKYLCISLVLYTARVNVIKCNRTWLVVNLTVAKQLPGYLVGDASVAEVITHFKDSLLLLYSYSCRYKYFCNYA